MKNGKKPDPARSARMKAAWALRKEKLANDNGRNGNGAHAEDIRASFADELSVYLEVIGVLNRLPTPSRAVVRERLGVSA